MNEAPHEFLENPNDESARERMIEPGGDPDWLLAAGFMDQSQPRPNSSARDEDGAAGCYVIIAGCLVLIVALIVAAAIYYSIVPYSFL